MKKLSYLMTMLFAVLILTTSCTEEDPITPDKSNEGLITLTELEGQWNIQYYAYNGDTINFETADYYDNKYDNTDNTSFAYVLNNLNFNDETVTHYNIEFDNPDSYLTIDDFTKEENVITVTNKGVMRYVYTVIDYNTNTLKLKLNETGYAFDCLGGVLVLTR